MYAPGSYIKWTAEDHSGKFEHVGEVLRVRDERFVEFVDENGHEFGVPIDDGQIEQIKKPRGWKNTAPEPIKKKAAPKRKSGSEPTKKEQALILVRDTYGRGHGKKIAIQRLMDVLNMSKAGASTYFYDAKRTLGLVD